MGVAEKMKWSMMAGAMALSFTLFIGSASARNDCDQTVCAMTTAEAKSLAAKACGWKTLSQADCKCLDTGGMCGGTLTGKNKGYHRCRCSRAPESQAKSKDAQKSRCFEAAREAHRVDGALAGKVKALGCVGIPVDANRLKTLIGPKPGPLRLSVSPRFAERTSLRLELGKASSATVIPGQVILVVDPHVNRVQVASGGRGFRLTELIARPAAKTAEPAAPGAKKGTPAQPPVPSKTQ